MQRSRFTMYSCRDGDPVVGSIISMAQAHIHEMSALSSAVDKSSHDCDYTCPPRALKGYWKVTKGRAGL